MKAWLATGAGKSTIAAGLAASLAALLLLDFPDDTGAGRRLFFCALLGGLAAFGAWGLSGIPALVTDLVRAACRQHSGGPHTVHHKGPLPELSARKQADVRRVVRAMAQHGLFAPEVPDPALLYAGVAEQEFSVKPDSILQAMAEVDYYHPDTDPQRWMDNLVLHDSKGEQDEAQQIADLARLAGDALDVRGVTVRHEAIVGHARAVQVDVAMTVNGETLELSYQGDVKYLSTHIHHALAKRVRAGGGGKRLATLWIADQGMCISLVEDDAVESLNTSLKLESSNRCEWSWLDEGEPMAAGQLLIERGLR